MYERKTVRGNAECSPENKIGNMKKSVSNTMLRCSTKDNLDNMCEGVSNAMLVIALETT
jgi:hypothetical protein